MAAEDERLLQRALRAEEPAEAERAAIIRVREGLARHSFIVGRPARRSRPLASTAVFAITTIALAAVFALACLQRQGPVPAGSSGRSLAAAASSPASPPATDEYPVTFVEASPSGVDIVSSATGNPIRTLPSGPPGVERSPSIIDSSATLYVTDTQGACGGPGWSEEIVAVSTDGGPATAAVTTPEGSVDELPAVSPDGKMLAWVRSPCTSTVQVIDVLDIATQAQRAIRVPNGQSVSALAWAPDDQRLLTVLAAPAATAPIVTVLSAGTATSTGDGTVLGVPLCASAYPRFLRDGTFVALACPPSAAATDVPEEIDVNATTGQEVRMLQSGAALPPVSAGGLNPLLVSLAFSPDGRSAIWTALGNVSVSISSGGRVVSLGGPFDDTQVTW